MEDKKQDLNLLEELVKIADSYRAFFSNLADELSKALADIKAPDKEEDTWEMECPYKVGDKHYCIQPSGDVFLDSWEGIEADHKYFSQGNIFPTEQAALLEAERRNLLTRFRAFRDECNGNWKPDWENRNEYKYYIGFQYREIRAFTSYALNGLETFGHLKNIEDCEKAIELFGKEIKELFMECE